MVGPGWSGLGGMGGGDDKRVGAEPKAQVRQKARAIAVVVASRDGNSFYFPKLV